MAAKKDETGIFTAEGNVAGARAGAMAKQREKLQEEFEKKKQAIAAKHSSSLKSISSKFSAYDSTFDKELSERTVGLLTAEEFERQKRLAEERAEADRKRSDTEVSGKKPKGEDLRTKQKKKFKATLSFADEVDIEPESAAGEGAGAGSDVAGAPAGKRARKGKNPKVDTSFLPDADRDRELQRQKEALAEEWKREQERIKQEPLEVTYSYWDGSGHRRTITVQQGFTVGKFLEAVRQDLMSEFPELKGVSSENLLYVKEDLIIPHNYSFYYLIVNKARGKSGPLFHFDVHDDVRLMGDATVEKDESHPGKIVERRWFERNKHIFPASRWEVYDPTVKYESYTIHGNEVR